jgi:hypothetical protein
MKELFHVFQHKDFPERFYGVIVGDKEISAIPVYNYSLEPSVIFTKNEFTVTQFYTCVIPQTYEDEYIVLSFLYTQRRLPLLGVFELVPKFYVKFALNRIYNIIISALPGEEVSLSKDKIKHDILNLFELEPEGLIVESEYKAKAFLIHANKAYHRHYIVRRV